VPEQVEVKAIRTQLRMTQTEFADMFGFTISSVRNWEQRKRTPKGPARILLTVIAHEPNAVLRALKYKAAA
jgi:putative transcriptional regulator